jgi:small subunit ribosomal protein S6
LLRDYEILYIVRPDLDEGQLNEAVAQVNGLIENLGGSPKKTDVWGRRRLAYEVRHLREGQYVLTDFEIEPTRVPEMEATLKISDTVFRHLIVRKPELGGDGAQGGQATADQAAAPEAAEAEAEPAVEPEAREPQEEPAGPAEPAEPAEEAEP